MRLTATGRGGGNLESRSQLIIVSDPVEDILPVRPAIEPCKHPAEARLQQPPGKDIPHKTAQVIAQFAVFTVQQSV